MMAVFGNDTSIGGTNPFGTDWVILIKASPDSSGIINSASFYGYTDSGATRNFRGVIYSYDSSSSGTLLAYTDDVAYTNTSASKLTASFSGDNIIEVSSGTNYWIGIHGDGGGVGNLSYVRATTTYTPSEDIYFGSSGISTTFSNPPVASFTGGVSGGGTYAYVTASISYTIPPTIQGISTIQGINSITL